MILLTISWTGSIGERERETERERERERKREKKIKPMVKKIASDREAFVRHYGSERFFSFHVGFVLFGVAKIEL